MYLNNRKAFTMIELIFVIIIIGVLSSIALPRFMGLGNDAHVAKIQRFVDTLNRTVSPSMWSGLQRSVPGANGSVKSLLVAAIPKYSSLFDSDTATPANAADAQIQIIPAELTVNADGETGVGITHDIPLNGCANADTSIAVNVGRIASAKIGNTIYNLGCIDGSNSISPHFFLDDSMKVITK